jgi:hypothetical protein
MNFLRVAGEGRYLLRMRAQARRVPNRVLELLPAMSYNGASLKNGPPLEAARFR